MKESKEGDAKELFPKEFTIFQIIKGYLKFLFKICKP